MKNGRSSKFYTKILGLIEIILAKKLVIINIFYKNGCASKTMTKKCPRKFLKPNIRGYLKNVV